MLSAKAIINDREFYHIAASILSKIVLGLAVVDEARRTRNWNVLRVSMLCTTKYSWTTNEHI